MGIPLTIGTTTFDFPTSGQEAGWGEDATGWAKAVTDLLQSTNPPGTINEAQALIDNNQTNQEVSGLLFSQLLTKSAIVFYRIERDTDSMSLQVEQGVLNIVFNGTDWLLSREITAGEPTGVQLDIDSIGQVKYTSTNLSGANYTGIIRFKTNGVMQ